MGKRKGLTEKQRVFVYEYTKDYNAYRAYRTAYRRFNGKEADFNVVKVSSHKMLYKPAVQQYLAEHRENVRKRAELEGVDVLLQDRQIALFNCKEVFDEDGTPLPPNELPDFVAQCIKSFEIDERTDNEGNLYRKYKYHFWDKHKALDRLYRYLELSYDSISRNEVTGKDGGPIQQVTHNTQKHELPTEIKELYKKVTGQDYDEQSS